MSISEVKDDIVFIAILKCSRQDQFSVSINCDQFLQSFLRAGMANTMEFCQLLSSFQHGKLDKIEAKLVKLETSWMNSAMRLGLIDLDRSIQNQGELINVFSEEVFALEKDIEGVRHIGKSIPKTCFSIAKLEPINPKLRWRS